MKYVYLVIQEETGRTIAVFARFPEGQFEDNRYLIQKWRIQDEED